MPRPSDHSKLPELAVLALGMFIGLVITNTYFVHGPALGLTRINQTERITVECKAGPPTAPTSSESSKPSHAEMILLGICVCACWLGFLKFMTAVELVERMEKLEARIESIAVSGRAGAEWQLLSEGISKLETQMLQLLEK
jgi:hypothetical protein